MRCKKLIGTILLVSLVSTSQAQVECFIPASDSLYVLGMGCIGPSLWPSIDSTNPAVDTVRLDGLFNVGHLDPFQLPNDSTLRRSCAFVVRDSSQRFTYRLLFDPVVNRYWQRETLRFDTWNGIPDGFGAIVLQVYDGNALIDTMRVSIEIRFYTSVPSEDHSAPLRPVLWQNYPNPFNGQTVIPYYLHNDGPVTCEVYSLTGQCIAVLQAIQQSAGPHELLFDAHNLASGTYVIRLVTRGYSRSITCQLLK